MKELIPDTAGTRTSYICVGYFRFYNMVPVVQWQNAALWQRSRGSDSRRAPHKKLPLCIYRGSFLFVRQSFSEIDD